MKIQYASDLHLEFEENRDLFDEGILKPSADILILAGDISRFQHETILNVRQFEYLRDNWKQVYVIPGNHEFYGRRIMFKAFDHRPKIFDNVQYVNNQSIVIDDVEIFFTTLWSKLSSSRVEGMISDFYHCKMRNKPYRYIDHNNLHTQAVEWLDKAIKESKANKKIVVSHFVPSLKVDGYPSEQSNDIFKEYFVCNNIDSKLQEWDIDTWIYGHNHFNNDVEEFGIKFKSNMLGYVMHGEHEKFDGCKVIEI